MTASLALWGAVTVAVFVFGCLTRLAAATITYIGARIRHVITTRTRTGGHDHG